jgi:hypothetical protein
MYSLLEQPAALSLSKNNAIFKWQLIGSDSQSEKVRKGPGVKLTFPNTIDAGEILGSVVVFTSTDGTSITFSFVSSAAADNQISAVINTPPSISYESWIALTVLPKFKNHPQIAPFFEVTLSGLYEIVFRSKKYTDGLTPALDITAFEELSKTTLAAPADNKVVNHRIVYEVFFEKTYKAGNYERVFEGLCTANTEGVCKADIAKLLHDELLLSNIVKPFNTAAPQILNNSRRYYVRYTDESGDPVVRNAWTVSAIKMVMLGGVPKNLDADYGFISSLSQNALLTNAPTAKIVTIDQLHYLAWINYTGSAKNVKLQCFFTANTEPTDLNADLSAISVQPFETVLIPLRADLIELPANDLKYQVRVLDNTGGLPLSEWRAYNVTYEYEEHRRYLQYINNFGAPESVMCVGTLNSSLEIERELSTTTEGTLQVTKQHRAKMRLPMAYNVGYMSRWEIEAMYDGVIENTFFEVDTEGYIKLNVLTKKLPNFGSETVEHTLTIDAEPAYDMENFGTMAYNLMNNSDANTPNWMTMTEKLWRKVHLKKW